MNRITSTNSKRKTSPRVAALALLLGLSGVGTAQAVTVFGENFEGYNLFPNTAPNNVAINAGIPKISEGASEIWYGARYENPSNNGSINSDLAVQQFGGLTNNTHTGRVEDDAGMLFKLDTTNLDSVNLSFNWRTFSVSTNDRFVVGYHIGPIAGFGACTGNGEPGCFADLRKSLPWYTAQGGTTTTGNWTQLLRATRQDAWQSASYLLPNAVENQSEVWVSFWLDNGEGDFAQIDNILVTAIPVPEADTYAMMLAGLGLIGFMVSRRRKS